MVCPLKDFTGCLKAKEVFRLCVPPFFILHTTGTWRPTVTDKGIFKKYRTMRRGREFRNNF